MALMCNCDIQNINQDNNRDIFISNLSIEAFGRHTGQAFEADIITYQTDNNFNWGPVHHAKVLYSSDDVNSATKIMFLRFCDTSCHEEVIAELNRVEWPVGYGKQLKLEFNRNYTRQHQLLARERYVNRDAATQTETIVAASIPRSVFGSTSSISTICYWTSEDCIDDKYSILSNEDDASTVLNAKQCNKTSKVKNKGSIKKMMAKLVAKQSRIY